MDELVTDSELAALREHVERALPNYMADLERLVNIDCGSYTKAGVDEVGGWVADQLSEIGCSVTVESNPELGDTIVGELSGSDNGRVLIVGHTDTVFDPGTVAERPFRVRDGRAHGPGVNDMKAGVLAGLYSLRAVRAVVGGLPFARLTFVANPDEEIGSPSSTPFIERAARDADVALVLELARRNGDIVTARKGIADYELVLHGRAAHSGVEPEKGRSAIVEAAHKTLALTALNGRWPGVTVNVGLIDGGTRPNIVADRCRMQIDVRATTREDLAACEAAIREICATSSVPAVTCEVRTMHGWPPMEKTAATAELADAAFAIAGRLGFELHDASTGGASDANTTSGSGAATLDGLGPVGGDDHAPGEYTEIESIVPRVTLLAALLLAVSRGGPRRSDQRR